MNLKMRWKNTMGRMLASYKTAGKSKRIGIASLMIVFGFGAIWVPGVALLSHELGFYSPLKKGLTKAFPRLPVPAIDKLLEFKTEQ